MKTKRVFMIVLTVFTLITSNALAQTTIEYANSVKMEDSLYIEIGFNDADYDLSKLKFTAETPEDGQWYPLYTALALVGGELITDEKDKEIIVIKIPLHSMQGVENINIYVAYDDGDWHSVSNEQTFFVNEDIDENISRSTASLSAQSCLQCTTYVYQITGINFFEMLGKNLWRCKGLVHLCSKMRLQMVPEGSTFTTGMKGINATGTAV